MNNKKTVLFIFTTILCACLMHATLMNASAQVDKIYWTDLTTGKIVRTDIDGTDKTELVTGLSNPSGIALDVSAGKIYWTDQGFGKILAANLDGSDETDVLTGLSKPTAIALTSSKIYWTDTSDYKIYSANLDGSSQTPLVSNVSSSGIAVTSSKIYWTDYSADKIRSADLTGSNQTDLITTGSSPAGIDVTSSYIYWVDTLADKIQYAPIAGGTATDLITTGLNVPRSVAVTSEKIYWAESNSGEIEVADLQNNSISNRKTLVSTNAWNVALLIGKSEPEQPTSLTAIPNADKTVALSWTAPTNTGGYSIDGYVIKQTGPADNTYNTTSTSYTTPALANGQYSWTVAAKNVVGTSIASSSSSARVFSLDVADAVPGLSSQELSQLAALLKYDTVIFNELHNGSDDATDWLELRNVSAAAIELDDYQLTILTGESSSVVQFPADTVIPAGDVLLITNPDTASADISVLSVVSETFVIPQTDFALILRSPTAFSDLAGNYFEGDIPATAPAFTVDTVWDRTQPTVFGYRAEAWSKSTYQNGLGSPGYQPLMPSVDINSDGVVNIFDLVLVASQFGTTSTTADLNGDGTVNMVDLALVAGALGPAIGAPTANQSNAAIVNTWLKLARENAVNLVVTSIPEGFSYQRGIAMLEALARALTPDTTALLANYPNPFNPETWIPYQLSKAADVTITIYASDGSVVRTLALGHQDVGMYKTRSQAAYWDGKNETGESVASGVYFYTLTAGDFSATRKMLILK